MMYFIKCIYKLPICAVLLLISIGVISQESNDTTTKVKEDPRDKVKYQISLEQNNCEAYIVATIDIIEGWHINGANLPFDCYSLPTEILIVEDTSFFTDSDSIIEPEYEEIYDKVAKEMLYLHDSTVIMKKKITIHADSSFMLKGVFSFQTCDDVHCLPPFSEEFSLTVSGCNENLKPNEETSNNLIFLILGGAIIFITSIVILRKRKG